VSTYVCSPREGKDLPSPSCFSDLASVVLPARRRALPNFLSLKVHAVCSPSRRTARRAMTPAAHFQFSYTHQRDCLSPSIRTLA
jgi:hypothetical protein